MLQVQSNPYEVGALVPLNEAYNRMHGFIHEDVNAVNYFLRKIESTRSNERPMPGDIVLYTNVFGDYYPHSIIEKTENGLLHIYHDSEIPFVYSKDQAIEYSICGGEFSDYTPVSELKYLGKVHSTHKVWGHNGECGDGAIRFDAQVNLWEYTCPDNIYGHFTTKTWRKILLEQVYNSQTRSYALRGEGLYFPGEGTLQAFMNAYCGTIFPGPDDDTFVLWCYRENVQPLNKTEWDAIDSPEVVSDDFPPATKFKIVKDFKNHILNIYQLNC